MNISSALFDRGALDLDSCPDESLPEFAFIGRSNVGKSSLLNMLVGKTGLARVSTTPGFTKMINVFTINKNWRLVDLPGYGFAQVARQDSARFNEASLHYLEHRPNLSCVFALIDSSLPPQKIDLEFLKWLTDRSLPFVLVFTKTDRVASKKVQANVAAFTASIAPWFQKLPATFTCSAKTAAGRKELLDMIDQTLASEKAERAAQPEKHTADAPLDPSDAPDVPWKKSPPSVLPKHLRRARPW